MKFVSLLLITSVAAWPQTAGRRLTIEAVGTAEAAPEVLHLMMKMEHEAGLAADATTGGERRLREFLSAVDGLRISNLAYRVSNNVITPQMGGYTPGIVYSRNIVFTLPYVQADRNRVVAQLEDLGARYNSHCVTCIGSG